MESPSFWEQDVFSRSRPYDLVVVGAGIVGLSSALFYKQDHPEAEVAVVERGARPLGASTRNAGFACVGSIGEHQADLRKESEAVVKQRIKRRYRGLVLVTDEQENLPWKGTFHHDRGYVYFRNVGDRLLIGGARNLAFEEEATDRFGTNDQIRNYLVDFVSDVLRLPDGWSVDHQWSGIMGFTESKTPVVQQLDECRYVAGGLSGMGIAIGMEVGRDAVEMIGGSG